MDEGENSQQDPYNILGRARAWQCGDEVELDALAWDIGVVHRCGEDFSVLRRAIEELLPHEHLPRRYRVKLLICRASTTPVGEPLATVREDVELADECLQDLEHIMKVESLNGPSIVWLRETISDLHHLDCKEDGLDEYEDLELELQGNASQSRGATPSSGSAAPRDHGEFIDKHGNEPGILDDRSESIPESMRVTRGFQEDMADEAEASLVARLYKKKKSHNWGATAKRRRVRAMNRPKEHGSSQVHHGQHRQYAIRKEEPYVADRPRPAWRGHPFGTAGNN